MARLACGLALEPGFDGHLLPPGLPIQVPVWTKHVFKNMTQILDNMRLQPSTYCSIEALGYMCLYHRYYIHVFNYVDLRADLAVDGKPQIPYDSSNESSDEGGQHSPVAGPSRAPDPESEQPEQQGERG